MTPSAGTEILQAPENGLTVRVVPPWTGVDVGLVSRARHGVDRGVYSSGVVVLCANTADEKAHIVNPRKVTTEREGTGLLQGKEITLRGLSLNLCGPTNLDNGKRGPNELEPS